MKPTDAEVRATTLPGERSWSGWYCSNHPAGEYLANAPERARCWGCTGRREDHTATAEQVSSMRPVTVIKVRQ